MFFGACGFAKDTCRTGMIRVMLLPVFLEMNLVHTSCMIFS